MIWPSFTTSRSGQREPQLTVQADHTDCVPSRLEGAPTVGMGKATALAGVGLTALKKAVDAPTRPVQAKKARREGRFEVRVGEFVMVPSLGSRFCAFNCHCTCANSLGG